MLLDSSARSGGGKTRFHCRDGRWAGTDRCMGRKVEQNLKISSLEGQISRGWTCENSANPQNLGPLASTRLTAFICLGYKESGEEDAPTLARKDYIYGAPAGE
jgi:hypothetical protein